MVCAFGSSLLLVLPYTMYVWINNIPLSATYNVSSPTSKFFSGHIPVLRVLPGLPVYLLRITARLPTI